jgi:imidazoleglycerol phosphate synthase glutamine amidotransferase subunit HisH
LGYSRNNGIVKTEEIMIVVIDYNMGNIGSVLNMCKKVGIEARLSKGPEDLNHADKLILPGVGSFDEGMTNLERLGYLPVLNHCVSMKSDPFWVSAWVCSSSCAAVKRVFYRG